MWNIWELICSWWCHCACMLSFVWFFWDPMDCSPWGSSVCEIFQARKWVDCHFLQQGSSQPRDWILGSCISCIDKVKSLSCVRLFATPWIIAYQAPLSGGFSRQGYWSGSPFPYLGDLPNPGIEPGSPTLQADALPSEPPGKLVMLLHKTKAIWVIFPGHLGCLPLNKSAQNLIHAIGQYSFFLLFI